MRYLRSDSLPWRNEHFELSHYEWHDRCTNRGTCQGLEKHLTEPDAHKRIFRPSTKSDSQHGFDSLILYSRNYSAAKCSRADNAAESTAKSSRVRITDFAIRQRHPTKRDSNICSAHRFFIKIFRSHVSTAEPEPFHASAVGVAE